MTPRGAAAGRRLALYAIGGTLAGVVGFGVFWRGMAGAHWATAAFGLALLLFGLDRAAVAMNASVLARRVRESGGGAPRPGPPAPSDRAASGQTRPAAARDGEGDDPGDAAQVPGLGHEDKPIC